MLKKKKSSHFLGVHWDSKKKGWRCQVRAAGFHRLYRTEMEAAVHYNEVARATWPDLRAEPLSSKLINNPWDVRENIGDIELPDGRFYRLDIDATSFAVIDRSEALYTRLKDLEWFMKDGFAWVIIKYDPDLKCFEYRGMHELLHCGPCDHDNGDRLDNRRSNLVEPGTARCGHPYRPLMDLRRGRSNSRYLEKLYLRRLADFLDWRQKVKDRKDVGCGCPDDPRLDERFRPVLTNLNS